MNDRRHTISVLVEHNFNALSRVIGMFSGKGYKVDTISFGTAAEEGMARLTLTTIGDEHMIEQITKQLEKLIDVIKVDDLTYEPFVERELALIKLSSDITNRVEVMQVVEIFRGNIIDISPTTITVEVTGKEEKIDAALTMLRQFELIQVARTGSVALKREYNKNAEDKQAIL